MLSSRSVWAQSSLRTKIAAGVAIIVGFALLFFIEYIYGNKIGLLASVLWALVSPGMFAVSILFLSVGRTSMRQEHIAWYKQQNLLLGSAFVFVACSMLTTFASFNRIFPPLLALFLGSACIVLAFLCIIQSIRVSQEERRVRKRTSSH